MMMERYEVGFWRIFRELFESASMAALILAIYSGLQLGYIFYQVPHSKGFIDSFGGALLMVGMGYLMMLPFLIVGTLILGAPVAQTIYRRHWDSVWVLILVGGFVAFLFWTVFFEIISDEPFSFSKFIDSTNQSFIAGGLTGFFFYRKMEKLIDAKDSKEDSKGSN